MRLVTNRTKPLTYTWVDRFGEFQIYKRVHGTQVQIGTANTQSYAEEIVDALNAVDSN